MFELLHKYFTEGSKLEYIEKLDKSYNDLLNVTVTEVYVMKGAKCRYSIIQNLPNNIYNLSNKTALVEDGATMIWNDLNIGSKINMKYPKCILNGNKSKGYYNAYYNIYLYRKVPDFINVVYLNHFTVSPEAYTISIRREEE